MFLDIYILAYKAIDAILKEVKDDFLWTNIFTHCTYINIY